MVARKHSIDVREDVEFARRQWRIQRIGWVAILIVLLLALGGLFGKGPLSHATATNGTLRVDYERFIHANTPTTLQITIHDVSDTSVRLTVDRKYLEAVPIQQTWPDATHTESGPDGVTYDFAASAAHEDLRITLSSTALLPGMPDGTIRVVHGGQPATVHLSQVIYP